jgi:hypothetical protein
MAEKETMTDSDITDDIIGGTLYSMGEELIIRHWCFGWDLESITGGTKQETRYGYTHDVGKYVDLHFSRDRSIPNYAQLVAFEKERNNNIGSSDTLWHNRAEAEKKAMLLAGDNDLRLSSLKKSLNTWDNRPKQPGRQHTIKPRETFEANLKKAREERAEKERLEKILYLAEQGDADAQYELGIYYSDGKGVLKDTVKALKLIKKAAVQGNSNANDYLTKLKAETIFLFNTTKNKIPTERIADNFDILATEFENIEQTFKLFPDSFGVQAYIDECEKFRKQGEWVRQGLCWYCGGKLSLFIKKCKSCGKRS